MKKTLFFVAILALGFIPANAQLGGLLQKAAQKTVQKATEKVKETATNAATAAVNQKVDQATKSLENAANAATYADLMQQLPELPTEQQWLSHMTAELNNQTFKLLASPVTAFTAKATGLSMKALSLAYNSLDSTQLSDMVYRQTEAATGLSREELDALSQMSDEEQEAFLAAHYTQGTAEKALLQQTSEAAQYLEPLQPLIDQWDAAGKKAEAAYANADEQCSAIYAKYASQLATAKDKDKNDILLQYYAEIIPFQRAAVQESMQIRRDEQLPIAEEIEKQMVEIRLQHPDFISTLLNYPQLTASQFFTDPSRMLDIPEYGE